MEIYIKSLQVGSCACLTKTPEAEYHTTWCKYGKLERAIITFELWFSKLPDTDLTLLNKRNNGWYKDADMNFAFITYCQGLMT